MQGLPGSKLDPSKRRRLGQYYTPDNVALPLVRWGLRGRPRVVLDPSFGGCSFLRAALRALAEVGAPTPASLIYGIDIALEASVHGSELVSRGVPQHHLIIADFFATSPSRLPPVDLIVGNPPYIRHHWFQDKDRHRAIEALARQNIRLQGRSNAWAYFLVHSGAFLKKGGRMAMLLPGAACFTQYSTNALSYIQKHAGRCALVKIGARVFSDAQEETVILLVEDWGLGPCSIQTAELETTADLESWLGIEPKVFAKDWKSPTSLEETSPEESIEDLWISLRHHRAVHLLRDLAQIKIGVVTGANRFFVCNRKKANLLRKDGARTVPTIGRSRALTGLIWKPRDQQELDKSGLPAHLILVQSNLLPRGHIQDWIEAGEKQGYADRLHCRKREKWYALTDTQVPDAFLPYMGEAAPRIILNGAGALVTNSIHRIWWKDPDIQREAISVATATSLFILACEHYGRRYGGGVLKVEPGAALRLPIPLVPAAGEALTSIDTLLRSGRGNDAQKLADKVVLEEGLGLSQADISAIRKSATNLAMRRLRLRG